MINWHGSGGTRDQSCWILWFAAKMGGRYWTTKVEAMQDTKTGSTSILGVHSESQDVAAASLSLTTLLETRKPDLSGIFPKVSWLGCSMLALRSRLDWPAASQLGSGSPYESHHRNWSLIDADMSLPP
jgi:hypothetical protein